MQTTSQTGHLSQMLVQMVERSWNEKPQRWNTMVYFKINIKHKIREMTPRKLVYSIQSMKTSSTIYVKTTTESKLGLYTLKTEPRCWNVSRISIFPFSALTLMVGWQKSRVFVGGDDSTGALHVVQLQLSLPPPSSLAPIKSRMETFWYWLTPACSGKWPLNVCRRRRLTAFLLKFLLWKFLLQQFVEILLWSTD